MEILEGFSTRHAAQYLLSIPDPNASITIYKIQKTSLSAWSIITHLVRAFLLNYNITVIVP